MTGPFDELVKGLGSPSDFDDLDQKMIEYLEIAIQEYNQYRDEKEPRVREFVSDVEAVERLALELAKKIESLSENLLDLPNSHLFAAALHDFLFDDLDQKAGSCFSDDLRSYATRAAELRCAMQNQFGPDRGGRGGLVSKISGSPKLRFARVLAPIWHHFKGWPTGTVGGGFFSFVCAAHECATGEAVDTFDEAKHAATEFSRLWKLREKVETRRDWLHRTSKRIEGRAYADRLLEEAKAAPALERRAVVARERARRLSVWLENPKFPRRH